MTPPQAQLTLYNPKHRTSACPVPESTLASRQLLWHLRSAPRPLRGRKEENSHAGRCCSSVGAASRVFLSPGDLAKLTKWNQFLQLTAFIFTKFYSFEKPFQIRSYLL